MSSVLQSCEPTPTAGPGSDELAAALRPALMKLVRWLRRVDAGAAGGCTPAEISVLTAVARSGPCGVGSLAHSEQLNPTMLSRLIGHLIEQGLLAREDDPSDRRAALVSATGEGRRLHERLRSERTRALGSLLGQLDSDQADAVLAALPALESLAELARSDRR